MSARILVTGFNAGGSASPGQLTTDYDLLQAEPDGTPTERAAYTAAVSSPFEPPSLFSPLLRRIRGDCRPWLVQRHRCVARGRRLPPAGDHQRTAVPRTHPTLRRRSDRFGLGSRSQELHFPVRPHPLRHGLHHRLPRSQQGPVRVLLQPQVRPHRQRPPQPATATMNAPLKYSPSHKTASHAPTGRRPTSAKHPQRARKRPGRYCGSAPTATPPSSPDSSATTSSSPNTRTGSPATGPPPPTGGARDN